MDQQVSELSEQERAWVAEQIAGVKKFIAAFSPADADKPVTLAALDRAFAEWLATREQDQKLVNAAINCVGVAFGQFLVKGAGFNWVIASDDLGTELAVLALPGKGDVLIYPANFVAKRWQRDESNFLEASFKTIANQVQSLSKASG